MTTTSSSDYISALPDPLISHILSFLPTKSAAATSILSKRWTPLWLSVPILDFDEEQEPIHHIINSHYGDNDDDDDDYHDKVHDAENCFLQMVHDAFSKRDVTQSVLKFRLKICYFEAIHVCKWVNTAIHRGVEHLDLLFSYEGVMFPAHILGSRTLVVLNLNGCQIDGVFIDGFPNLRVLHLNEIYFMKHRYLMQLIFGCPILEELCVHSLFVDDDIDDAGGFQSLDKLASAVVLTPAHHIPLTYICNVKSLTLLIHKGFPEVTCTFRNLTSLELRFRIYDNNLDCHFVDVFKVLQHCPKLQNLEILMMADSKDVTDKYKWVQPQFVPECLSSHISTCTLRGCKGWDSEFQFAKYMLQNAKVLSSMRICSELFSNPLTKLKITEKLSFPWGSETCELHLDVRDEVDDTKSC